MTTDPLNFLAVNAAVAIVTIIGTLTVQWITARFAQHAAQESIKASNAALHKVNADLQHKLDASQSQVLEQKAKYNERFSREAVFAKYTLDDRTGTYLLENRHFCARCLHGERQSESPVTLSGAGDVFWKCHVCNAVYDSKVKG